MRTILNADQIRLLRTEWLDDLVDRRPEWGASPVIADTASAGAVALNLSGLLHSQTLKAGTSFVLSHNGRYQTYYVHEDAKVLADGTATIRITPPLIGEIVEASAVKPEERRKSLFNKRTGRQFFSDTDLQDYAERAVTQRGAFIEAADEPQQMLFRAVRFYGWTMMLASDEYQIAVLANDDRGTNVKLLESKRALLAEDAEIIFGDRTGGLCIDIPK